MLVSKLLSHSICSKLGKFVRFKLLMLLEIQRKDLNFDRFEILRLVSWFPIQSKPCKSFN